MTITARVVTQQLYYRGNDDPSLPVGMWWGSATLLGDASGGHAGLRFVFHEEGDAVSSDIFNLEQFSILVSKDTTFTDSFIRTVGMAPAPKLAAFDRVWAFSLESVTPVGNAAGPLANKLGLPLFIGTLRSGDQGDLGALEIATTNPTAADSMSVSAMGYRWTSRSVLAPGGPQRPPGGGLFGAG